MNLRMKKDFNREKEVISALFNDTGFSEFTFHTSFQLRFTRNNNAEFEGKMLPTEIVISILTDWWFGSKDEWNLRVQQLTAGTELVEPDEPVLSYELTCLRWMDGSDVEKVYFEDDKMNILFKCGKSISILYYDEIDYAWVIEDCHNKNGEGGWSVICEDGELFVNIPKLYKDIK